MSHRIRGNAGEPLSQPPYGYMKSSENPKRWVIDEEAAVIVRRVFKLSLAGYGTDQIGDVLTKEKILSPVNYFREKGINRPSKPSTRSPFYWTHSSISKILTTQEYLGDVINFKTYSKSYKDKKRRENAKENQMIFEGVHEPIIDRETWERVQEKRGKKVRMKPKRTGERNMFSGLLVCATCGSNLNYHFNQQNHDIEYFNCSNNNSRVRTCNATHYIRVDFLEQVILSELRRITYYAERYEKEFAKVVLDSALREMDKAGRNRQKELDVLIARDKELDILFEKVYEDSVSGRITEDRFARMSQKYEGEQAEIKKKILPLKKEIAKYNQHDCSTDEFLDLVYKYADIKELTQEILREFIDHIVVHHAENIKGERMQKIEIFYNCIGVFEAPRLDEMPAPTIRLSTRKGVALSYTPERQAV